MSASCAERRAGDVIIPEKISLFYYFSPGECLRNLRFDNSQLKFSKVEAINPITGEL